MSASTYTIENIQKALYGGVAFPLPSGYYLGLHSGDPTPSVGANELSGNGYVRQVFTAVVGSAPAYESSNTENILFTADGGDWVEATYFSVWDTLSGGNMLDFSSIGSPVTLLDTKSFIVNPGDLTMNQV